jgi:hypothetical protein
MPRRRSSLGVGVAVVALVVLSLAACSSAVPSTRQSVRATSTPPTTSAPYAPMCTNPTKYDQLCPSNSPAGRYTAGVDQYMAGQGEAQQSEQQQTDCQDNGGTWISGPVGSEGGTCQYPPPTTTTTTTTVPDYVQEEEFCQSQGGTWISTEPDAGYCSYN